MSQQGFTEMLKKWVVNDYFTPNIKAEVILDTLLTPYIAELIQNGNDKITEELQFVTKEMSIFKKDKKGKKGKKNNQGPKIDYILASADTVYLVELKTTDSSTDADQLSCYRSLIAEEEKATFGAKLGERLLDILEKYFYVSLKCRDSDEALREAWKAIWEKCGNFEPKKNEPKASMENADDYHARVALELIKVKGWAWNGNQRSRKYFYTLGQLVDYINPKHKRTIWKNKLKVVYLTPNGNYPADENEDILRVSLKNIVPKLAAMNEDDEYLQMLKNIIEEIYGRENNA